MNARINDWLQWVLTSSVPLRKLDAHDNLLAVASGCLIDFAQRRFLLSVQHAIDRNSTDWVLEVGRDTSGGTVIYQPEHFHYVGEMTRGDSKIREIDFCYTEVPRNIAPRYQHISPRGEVFDDRLRHVFNTDLTMKPDSSHVYAFCGQVSTDRTSDLEFVTDVAVYPGLKYAGDEGEYHVFNLPVKHPGHDYFRGCSGAPVVDMNRNIVALVCDGDENSNTIRGISVSRYRVAFQFLAGQLAHPA